MFLFNLSTLLSFYYIIKLIEFIGFNQVNDLILEILKNNTTNHLSISFILEKISSNYFP